MVEQNNVQRYIEKSKVCEAKIAVLKPFLENFSKEHDAGTRFYNDITVLSGLSLYGPKWFNTTDEGNKLLERQKQNQVSIYTIKWAGASFVIEYDLTGRVAKPTNAFMVWNNQKFPVDLNTALAAKDLQWAQSCRDAIYAAHRAEIDRALNPQKVR